MHMHLFSQSMDVLFIRLSLHLCFCYPKGILLPEQVLGSILCLWITPGNRRREAYDAEGGSVSS